MGKGSFEWCKNLTTVKLPNNPRCNCIEEGAFAGCEKLGGLTIPGNITKICKIAFLWSGLKTIVLPDNVETMGEDSFGLCKNLTTVKFPNNPKYNCIGKKVFEGCKSLEKITLPDNIEAIEERAFSGSGLKTIVLPDGVKIIGEYAFSGCKKLTTVKLPSSLVYISNSAFYLSNNLRIVKIPVSLKRVEVDASEGRETVSIKKLLPIIYAAIKREPLEIGAKFNSTKSNPDDKVIEFDLNSIRISRTWDFRRMFRF